MNREKLITLLREEGEKYEDKVEHSNCNEVTLMAGILGCLFMSIASILEKMQEE